MMHVERAGSGSPVVLVHGLGAHLFSWRDTAAALATRRTTYAVDLLGFGESPTPAGFASTMAAQAEAVADLIRAQRLASPDLVGHSMGGGVCLRLAAEAGRDGWPAVGKVVLLAPVAYPPPDVSPWLGAGRQEPQGGAGDRADGSVLIGKAWARALLRRVYAPTSPVTEDQVRGYGRGLAKRSQRLALVEHARRLGQVAVPAAALPAITADTLIVWGDDDPVLPVGHATDLAAALPNAPLRRIARCGHVPHEERPAEVNGHIADFLP
jgi:pimeloyl-ACP methyl ester carboxylesterase